MHLFHHWAFEGVGMKQVLDCYWLLKQNSVNWSQNVGSAMGDADTDGCRNADAIRSDAMRVFRNVGIEKFVAALMFVLQQLGMDEAQMLCIPDEKYGNRLLNDILATGIVSAEELAYGKYGHESILHKFCRRFHRSIRMMPMAPSEMIWMLIRNTYRWVFSRDVI